jgi:hypothetical protein
MKMKFIVVILSLSTLLCSCSNKKDFIDPIWNINLNDNKSDIEAFLYKQTAEGLVLKSVFSFEKIIYLKKDSLDARITAFLNNPVYERNILTGLKYSFSVEFKNDNSEEFNTRFYSFFKRKMIEIYGNPEIELQSKNEIEMKWKLDGFGIVHLQVVRYINEYILSFQKL